MNQTAGAILRRKVGAIQTRGYSFPIQSELAAKLEYASAKGASSALRVTTEAIVEHSSVDSATHCVRPNARILGGAAAPGAN